MSQGVIIFVITMSLVINFIETYPEILSKGKHADPYKGPLQDWRYYKGHALTSNQILAIAWDSSGPAQKTCALREEAGDSSFVDLLGHDCG